jgi:cytochrome P450 family 135
MATAASSTPIEFVANGTARPVGPAPRLPPGPRVPATVQTAAWAVAPTWVMDQCSKRLGEAFTLTFAPSGIKLVVISDPEAVKTLFTAPPETVPSGVGSSPIASIMGPSSVIVLTGPEHMRQRKLLLPPFHGERMREYQEVIVSATKRDMAGWPLGTAMRLQERTRSITLEVILRAVFGVEAERMGALKEAIGGLLEPLNPLAMILLSLRSPSSEPPKGAVGRALERLDSVIYDELERRRSQVDLAERSDILSLLLQARDEDGQAMTDGELRDELVTLLLAGHETTSTSVSWAIERLVRHPHKLSRLLAEIDGLSEGGGEEYMSAVVSETLRVRPVVPVVVRVLQEDMRVGSHLLPKGTRVVPSIYLTNRSSRVYDDPEEFRPERFLENGPETFSWIPFGGGIRRCIGAAFATLEMKLILRTMLEELEPSMPAGGRLTSPGRWRQGEWTRRRAVTLVPGAGARVVWQRRSLLGG